MEYNFRNDAVRWRISNSINLIFTCFYFRQGTNCAHENNTQTYRHREIDKPLYARVRIVLTNVTHRHTDKEK